MLKQQQSVAPSITVSVQTLAGVRRSIHGCHACSDNAEISFARLLERFIGRFNSEPEYVLTEDVLCPGCMSPIENSTLVELQCNTTASAACA
jgi:hypothetical protein